MESQRVCAHVRRATLDMKAAEQLLRTILSKRDSRLQAKARL